MDKVVEGPAAAVADVPDGASIGVGGFGLSGIDEVITGPAVLAITPGGFALRELAPGVTVEQVRAATGAPVRTDD